MIDQQQPSSPLNKTILNDLPAFQQTFSQLKPNQKQQFDIKQLKQKIGLYSQQYVSGTNRQEFHQLFCEHNTIQSLVDLLCETNDFEVFQAVMKGLNIISYNIQRDIEVKYFLTHSSIHRLLQISNDRIEKYDAVESYVQFLKSIVQRLRDKQHVDVFFNERKPFFPLLWKIFLFYNQQRQNSRTTIKLIILEITKFHQQSIKQYLNNFPTLLFIGLFSRHVLSTIKTCFQKQNKQLLFEIADEINFIDEFSLNALPPTKNYILNSLIYYPIKYVWNSIGDISIATKDILWMILVFFLNADSDPVFSHFLSNIFFAKKIEKEVIDLMVMPSQQTLFYSNKGDNKDLENSKTIIEEHCKNIFFNNSNNKQSEKQVPAKTNKQNKQTILNKTIKQSQKLLSHIFRGQQKDSSLKQQLSTVSKIVGTTITLNSLGNDNYTDNIYIVYQTSPLLKSKIIQNNTFLSKLMDRLSGSPECIGLYLSIMSRLLKNENLSGVRKQLSYLFLDNLPHTLKIVKNNKTIYSILLILENILLAITNLDRDILQSLIRSLKQPINNISTSAFEDLLHSDFTDWQNYLEIFLNQQMFVKTVIEKGKQVKELNFEIEEEQLVICNGQLVIHYASMIRNIIRTFTEVKYKGCKEITEEIEKEIIGKHEHFENIKTVVNGQECSCVIQDNMLKFKKTDDDTVFQEQHLKKFDLNNESKNVKQTERGVQYYVSPRPLKLQFMSEDDKRTWTEEVKRMAQQIKNRQIKIIMKIVEDVPQIQ